MKTYSQDAVAHAMEWATDDDAAVDSMSKIIAMAGLMRAVPGDDLTVGDRAAIVLASEVTALRKRILELQQQDKRAREQFLRLTYSTGYPHNHA